MTTPVAAGTAMSAPAAGGLAEVIDTILDKGLVIDAFVRVSLIGIELLTIEVRVVVASVDTYLRFAEAIGRVGASSESDGSPLLTSQRQARHAAEGVVGRTAVSASRAPAAAPGTAPANA